METKSRYEIISELEQKKADLLNAQANIGLTGSQLKRVIEMAEEKLAEFESQKDIQVANIKDQLESIEKSLDRLNSQKK